ncbi:MAG: hypothetical protein JXR96_14015 [Deltaproteobacteria bacterium]|nr:hypothetical protein [Deltaproteobacteria bacterium]
MPRGSVIVFGFALWVAACGRLGFDGVETPCRPVTELPSVFGVPIEGAPVLAGAAHGFALLWFEDDDGDPDTEPVLVFQQLDTEGRADSDVLTVARGAEYPSIAALLDGWAVAYADERDGARGIYLRLVRDGAVGEERLVSDVGGDDLWMTALAVGGHGLAVFYHDRHEVYARLLTTGGEPLTEVVQLTDDPYIYDPPVAAAGVGFFGVAWADERGDEDVMFGLLSADGRKVPPATVAGAAGGSQDVSICYAGDGFDLAWLDWREGNNRRMLMASVGADARLKDGPYVVPFGNRPSGARMMRLDQDTRGLAWIDDDGQLWLGVVDRQGVALGSEIVLSEASGRVGSFALAQSGALYLAATAQQRYDFDGDGSWTLGPAELGLRCFRCAQSP